MTSRIPDIALGTQTSADSVAGVQSGAMKRFPASPSFTQLAAATGAGLAGYDAAEVYGAGTVGAAVALRLLWASVPASAAATGTAGQIAYASGFLYICVATDTWQRAALATW